MLLIKRLFSAYYTRVLNIFYIFKFLLCYDPLFGLQSGSTVAALLLSTLREMVEKAQIARYKPCALSKHVCVSMPLFLAAAPINFAGMQTGACRKAFAGHDTIRTAVRLPLSGGFAVQKPPKNLDNA